jgi:two-component system, NtrC family, sensor kinase
MRSITLILIFNLTGNICFGQKQLPTTPVFEIKSDTIYEQILNPTYYEVLEDNSGKWLFDEVSQVPISNLFHAKGVKVEGIDTSAVHTFWHRYRLKNTMATTAKISIGSYADLLDLYAKKADNSEWIHYQNGFLRDWNKRDGLKSGVIMFSLTSGEEMYLYVRRYRENVTNFKINIGFYSTEKFIQEQYIDYVDERSSIFRFFHLQEAFLLGLFLLTIFFNLFFYRISKEKSYLYFALFVLFLGINRLYNILDTYFYWEYPSLVQYVPYLSYAWAFIPFFLIQFVRAFFDTKGNYKKWDTLLNTIAFANVVIMLLLCFDINFKIYIFDFNENFGRVFSFVLIPISILITFGLYIRRKDTFQLYLVVGLSPMMIWYSYFQIARNMGYKFKSGFYRTVEVPCLLWLILILAWLLFMRYNKLKQKNEQRALDIERERNQLIEGQKVELEKQVKERTAELVASQNQLIQKEKLASLGELTAGIAHEIQNPLNFVNNFSELSVDLAKDLKEEIHKPDINKEYVEELLTDLSQNQEKINHHGKRASSIVKGMLEHSRASTGVKEMTDINALADEYFRLSYHGLRAKDKDFNANMEIDFDKNLPKINLIPQDMGRVLLNLFNNAFYAVTEKNKQNTEGVAFKPTVYLSTQLIDNQIVIKVKDNGSGMPDSVRAKVFQPFFTTKPTGSGTGLGLSLAYDIVTKGHGGTLEVISTEGGGTEFLITLRMQLNTIH